MASTSKNPNNLSEPPAPPLTNAELHMALRMIREGPGEMSPQEFKENVELVRRLELEGYVKEEIVMSIGIYGHGNEDYFSQSLSGKQLEYSKNNVRGFNLGCVPGFDTWETSQETTDLPFLYKMFKENQYSNTSSIMKEFIEYRKPKYQNYLKKDLKYKDFEPIEKGLECASGVITYLHDKYFNFSNVAYFVDNGIYVLDIRSKITYSNGSIRYVPFTNIDPNFKFNLINYTHLRFVLNIFNKDDLLEQAKSILGFDKISKDELLPDIYLNQLYNFFELINVKFVNIFDYTCRHCNNEFPSALSQQIYNEEQTYAEKPDAFGKKKRKSKKRVKKRKRSSVINKGRYKQRAL